MAALGLLRRVGGLRGLRVGSRAAQPLVAFFVLIQEFVQHIDLSQIDMLLLTQPLLAEPNEHCNVAALGAFVLQFAQVMITLGMALFYGYVIIAFNRTNAYPANQRDLFVAAAHLGQLLDLARVELFKRPACGHGIQSSLN